MRLLGRFPAGGGLKFQSNEIKTTTQMISETWEAIAPAIPIVIISIPLLTVIALETFKFLCKRNLL